VFTTTFLYSRKFFKGQKSVEVYLVYSVLLAAA